MRRRDFVKAAGVLLVTPWFGVPASAAPVDNNLLVGAVEAAVEGSYASDSTRSYDAFIPEIWAQESLRLLEESMVVGCLVHRDFHREPV